MDAKKSTFIMSPGPVSFITSSKPSPCHGWQWGFPHKQANGWIRKDRMVPENITLLSMKHDESKVWLMGEWGQLDSSER